MSYFIFLNINTTGMIDCITCWLPRSTNFCHWFLHWCQQSHWNIVKVKRHEPRKGISIRKHSVSWSRKNVSIAPFVAAPTRWLSQNLIMKKEPDGAEQQMVRVYNRWQVLSIFHDILLRKNFKRSLFLIEKTGCFLLKFNFDTWSVNRVLSYGNNFF